MAEGAEIPICDLTTAEVDVVTRKVAGLSAVTSELVEDSSPEATARSVFSTSDRVAVTATCRVGFGFPRTAELVRIRLAAT